MWKVIFDERNAVYVEAPDADLAKLKARLQVWSVTDRWLEVLRVEKA